MGRITGATQPRGYRLDRVDMIFDCAPIIMNWSLPAYRARGGTLYFYLAQGIDGGKRIDE